MADRKITDLTALAAGSQATGDLLTIVDVSEAAATDKNKKITVESLFQGIPGDVGIGTSSPTRSLHVSGTTTNILRLENTNADVAGIELKGTGGTSSFFHNAGGFRFLPNGTERLRITSSGNVGIGTTSPGTILNIRSDSSDDGILLEKTDGTDIARLFHDGTTTDARLDLFSGGSANIQLKANGVSHFSGGNLGIGTSSPALSIGSVSGTVLHAAGAGTTGARFQNTSGTSIEFFAGSDAVINTGTSTNMTFKINDSEKMRIDSSGNVGIGTTPNSDSQLHVKSGANDGNPVLRLEAATNNFLNFRQTGSVYDINVTAGDPLSFTIGSSERMRIDSSGNVGIGTSSPGALLNLQAASSASLRIKNTQNNTPSASHIELLNNNNEGLDIKIDRSGIGSRARFIADAEISFEQGSSERMRITSGGKIFMNCTASSDTGILQLRNTVGSAHCLGLGTSSSNADTLVVMRHNTNANGSGGTTVGSITVNSTSTTYGTSSDYRLKENVVNLAGAIDRVKQLAPKRFNFIVDPNKVVDGFLAHEAQAVVPEAVHGTHNEVDDDGNAVMQLIDQSKLVPLLTAALQEAIAEIETLKTKVAALEAG